MLARTFLISREQLLREWSAKEIKRWQLLYELEPWGERNREILLAQVCQTVANFAQLGVKKHERVEFTIEDYMMQWGWGKKEEEPEKKGLKVWNAFKALSVQHNQSIKHNQEIHASRAD